MAFNPTDEQKQAIYTKENALVSAAAGSGKTAVLVSRVIDRFTDKENTLWADRALIVTFTNTAAAELRVRIEKKLNEAIEEDPYSQLLQRQKILLNNAKISTIDNFCMTFVKENFEKAGVDPSFKIAANSDLKMLESSCMMQLMNEQFEAKDGAFLSLLEYIGAEYDDTALVECIKLIYNYSNNMPYPEHWIERVVEKYKAFANGGDSEWLIDRMKHAKEFYREAIEPINNAVGAIEMNEEAHNKYGDNIYYIKKFIYKALDIIDAGEWNALHSHAASYAPPGFLKISAKLKSEESVYAKELRDKAQNLVKKGNAYFDLDEDAVRGEIAASVPHIEKIAELVIKFRNMMAAELTARGLMRFDMVEQAALQLITEYKDGKIVPSADAKDYISAYDAVMVDEYQDTNDLQDTLFNALSDNQKNLFCVGDAKQSIYRFRGANPHNFIEKKKLYQPDTVECRFGLRVDLSGNFRSRAGICEYVNRLFSFIMHEDVADIEYDEREQLKPLAEIEPCNEPSVEHHFVDLAAVIDDPILAPYTKDEKKVFAEATVIANLISDIVKRPPFIYENKVFRRAEYKDITILVSSPSVNGALFAKVLEDSGIPVALNSNSVFSSNEAFTVFSLLRVINNPFDDISMLGILTSSIYRFTADEIAEIKGTYKRSHLISSVTLAAKNGNTKAAEFIADLSYFREVNIVSKVYDLIKLIYDKTNFCGIVSRLPDGEARKRNLMAIQSLAASFEGDGKRNLREFLKVVEESRDKDIKAELPYAGNAVSITSIHSSKGLQFPICILAETGHGFNFQDGNKSLLIDEHYGFSLKYFDEDKSEKNNTIIRKLMAKYYRSQVLAEQARLLYVALTRAEHKLIVTGCFDNLKDSISALSDMSFVDNGRMRAMHFRTAKNFSNWILADEVMADADKYIAYLSEGTACEEIHTEIAFNPVEKTVESEADADTVAKLLKNYDYKYPYEELLSVESKASVTDIVHKADEEKYQFTSRPAFMNEKGMSAAEKGTATHKFMQYCDFAKCKVSLEDECTRLYEYGYLTYEESDAVNMENVKKFFESPLYARIESSSFVKREFNFIANFPASTVKIDLSPELADENVLIQGAVDLLFEEDGELVILDFKTDRNKEEAELVAAYREQLEIYAKACEKLLSRKVKELDIYSFSLGKAITI